MRTLPRLSFVASLALPLAAQGHLQWLPGEAAPGPKLPNGNVLAKAAAWWDPDGAGPLGEVLVVGGEFELPSVGARNLAWWDPATQAWGAFALQPNAIVRAVAVLANGHLAIGGAFTTIGHLTANHVAIFDGAAWSNPGDGITGTSFLGVQALQPMPNGDLVVGGNFSHAGGALIPGIARWDGSQWHALGVNTINEAKAIAMRPNGNLIVSGVFPVGLAEWNGVGWTTLTPGLSSIAVEALTVLDNGDVIAAGTIAGIWRWDGTLWTPLSVGQIGHPSALLPVPGGAFLAGRIGSDNGVPVDGVMLWNGSQWIPYAPGVGNISAMVWGPGGELILAGRPSSATEPVRCVGVWDGTGLRALSRGVDGPVRRLLPTPNGGALGFGDFSTAGGVPLGGVGHHGGGAWSPLPALPAAVGAVTVDAQAQPWVAVSTGVSTHGSVRRWTGTAWQTVGADVDRVTALLVTPTHGITVGTEVTSSNEKRIARWNGLQWEQYGAGLDWAVRALIERGNGELVAGGEFLYSGTTPVSRIARWDGAAWQPFASGFDGPVRALAELPNGDLVAAGDFIERGDFSLHLGLIARWDGSAWQPLGQGLAGEPGASVRSLLVLPNGDLLAGGSFASAGGALAANLARWDGVAWHPVDGGTDGTVLALARTANGDVLVGGEFARAGTGNSAHFAVLRSNLPATATAYGVGCNGAFGPLVLEPADLPWLGATWRSVCYGIGPGEIGIDLYGLVAGQSPLSVLHPTAVGCDLLTLPEVVMLRLPQNGAIVSTFAVPNDPSLIATPVFQQMLVAGLDASLAITSLASSNGLELQLGSF